MAETLTFIGFGEAGHAFASSIDRAGLAAVSGFDLKPESAEIMQDFAVTAHASAPDALAFADAVWCLVTADQAADVARQAAAHLQPGAFWFDGNSCSPGSKRLAAAAIEGGGGRYVDVAIMAPVHPLRAKAPLLLAGPHAQAAAEFLRGLGMQPTVVGDSVGEASTIKMMRSVMIKGIEALTAECVLGARRAGVDDKVLASLNKSDPGFDWPQRSAYNFERMAVHGQRRAAEMREVARTLQELDLPDRMAAATAVWQQQIADLAVPMDGDASVESRADRVLDALTRYS